MSEPAPHSEGFSATKPSRLAADPPPLAQEPSVELPAKPRRSSFVRQQALTIVIAGVVAAVVATLISIGGLLITAGPRSGDLYRQQGRVNIAAGNSHEVYYPIGYATPPNL